MQSTSSTEAELYAASSVCFEGRLLKHFLEWCGFIVHYRLHVDSSSAKAIMARDGVGKVKHLDVRVLWLQAERERFDLVIYKVPGDRNPADLGTKSHTQVRFEMLRDLVGIKCCAELDDYQAASVSSIEQGALLSRGTLGWISTGGAGRWHVAGTTSSQILIAKLAALATVAVKATAQVMLELEIDVGADEPTE